MRSLGPAYTKQKLHLDFTNLQQTCPKGVYVAPLPDESLTWAGVLFVRKGPYANAVLRFRIVFPDFYPAHPPTVTILNDVFHPLVTPLTTYSYSTRDTGGEGVSAADRDRLPPGGLSLRYGFPEWFGASRDGLEAGGAGGLQPSQHVQGGLVDNSVRNPPLTLEILQYLRITFSTDEMLDAVPWKLLRTQAHGTLGGAIVPNRLARENERLLVMQTLRATLPSNVALLRLNSLEVHGDRVSGIGKGYGKTE